MRSETDAKRSCQGVERAKGGQRGHFLSMLSRHDGSFDQAPAVQPPGSRLVWSTNYMISTRTAR
jgi:hypothetical protein